MHLLGVHLLLGTLLVAQELRVHLSRTKGDEGGGMMRVEAGVLGGKGDRDIQGHRGKGGKGAAMMEGEGEKKSQKKESDLESDTRGKGTCGCVCVCSCQG